MDNSNKTKQNKTPYRIYKLQPTEFNRFNKLKCPSEDASVPLGRKKKAIICGQRGRDAEGKSEEGEPDLVLGEGKRLKSEGQQKECK